MNKTVSFILGMILSFLIITLAWYLRYFLELGEIKIIAIGIPSVCILWFLFYWLATGKFKSKKEPEKVPGVHSVKQYLKGYSKNKLIQICISLQRDVNQLKGNNKKQPKIKRMKKAKA